MTTTDEEDKRPVEPVQLRVRGTFIDFCQGEAALSIGSSPKADGHEDGPSPRVRSCSLPPRPEQLAAQLLDSREYLNDLIKRSGQIKPCELTAADPIEALQERGICNLSSDKRRQRKREQNKVPLIERQLKETAVPVAQQDLLQHSTVTLAARSAGSASSADAATHNAHPSACSSAERQCSPQCALDGLVEVQPKQVLARREQPPFADDAVHLASASSDSLESSLGQQALVTTLMICNIPCKLQLPALIELIDSRGFSGTYDFIYLPGRGQSYSNMGYAFINFHKPETAVVFSDAFNGVPYSHLSSIKTEKIIMIRPARVQGFQNNVKALTHSHKRPLWLEYRLAILSDENAGELQGKGIRR